MLLSLLGKWGAEIGESSGSPGHKWVLGGKPGTDSETPSLPNILGPPLTCMIILALVILQLALIIFLNFCLKHLVLYHLIQKKSRSPPKRPSRISAVCLPPVSRHLWCHLLFLSSSYSGLTGQVPQTCSYVRSFLCLEGSCLRHPWGLFPQLL